MQAYYISQSNNYSIRTEPISTNVLTLGLQNMYTLENITASLTGVTYDSYESLLEFTASIASASVGAEYRATLIDSGSGAVWRGTFQIYSGSFPVVKSNYENQNQQYISHESENRYIIMN